MRLRTYIGITRPPLLEGSSNKLAGVMISGLSFRR